MSTIFIFALQIGLALAGVLFAALRGGPAERLSATVVVANIILGLAVREFFPGFESMFRFINDGLAAVALLAVTVLYAAPWMGGVMLFYAAQFSLHSYYLVTGRPDTDYLHALVNNIDFGGVICCLIAGTVAALLRRGRRLREMRAAAT